jgi:hypothetical protein
VGQRVIARHPKSKEHCIGSILTVDWNRCRVQFEHQEMGVELVAVCFLLYRRTLQIDVL